jgi:hydrogenase maturation protease
MWAKTDTGLLEIPEDSCRDAVRVLVLGLGNILLRDEGVGVHVAKCLLRENLPENVEVIDGGTAGLDILLSQQLPYKLLIIDAIKAGKKPGTIYETQLKPGEKERLTEIFNEVGRPNISLHQVGLLDALKAAERLECMPEEITIIGVEPAEVSLGLELTEPMKRSVPRVVEQVLEEIGDAVHRE